MENINRRGIFMLLVILVTPAWLTVAKSLKAFNHPNQTAYNNMKRFLSHKAESAENLHVFGNKQLSLKVDNNSLNSFSSTYEIPPKKWFKDEEVNLRQRQYRTKRGQPVNDMSDSILGLINLNQSSRKSDDMNVLKTEPNFNVSVSRHDPVTVDSKRLSKIANFMQKDCSKVPAYRSPIKWVSDTTAIRFQCLNGAWVTQYITKFNGTPKASSVKDCNDLHQKQLQGKLKYNVTRLTIKYENGESKKMKVMCKNKNNKLADHTKNVKQLVTGEWTIIQRRVNGEVNFYRPMSKYEEGFGNMESGEYWLGLKNLHDITSVRDYMLRIEITTGGNITYTSEYEKIEVGDQKRGYRLKLGKFITPSKKTLSSGDYLSSHNGGIFQTRDFTLLRNNCARLYKTGFWFKDCWSSLNLNGPYLTRKNKSGIHWAKSNPNKMVFVWKTEMMIKSLAS